MSDTIIEVNDIWKQFSIGAADRPTNLRELLERTATAPLRALRAFSGHNGKGNGKSNGSRFWALQGVSFEVRRGEVLGIIGRNGAGKSTLLKVLSRITEPTRGKVRMHGRVGALLEVGTGFHPELSGRENIFLNGSILGIRKAEIERKFDEIVAFAELEKFIDTAVKHYSSGMYLRLAFAVAAHLEPDILIVDEVLAVGDASFQKKCIGKMRDVPQSGRTVLFVSHNMPAVQSLCTRCILLDKGQVHLTGSPYEVASRYLEMDETQEVISRVVSGSRLARMSLTQHTGRAPGMHTLMRDVLLQSESGEATAVFVMGEPWAINVRFESPEPFSPVLGVVIKTLSGIPLFGLNNRISDGAESLPTRSAGTIKVIFEGVPLMPGHYLIDLYLGSQHQDMDIVHGAISFAITGRDVFGTGHLPPASAGYFCYPARFTMAPVSQ